MSALREKYISTGLSNGDHARFEPRHAENYANATLYGQSRFHPYTRHRPRNCYEAYYASGFYPENVHAHADIGNYYYLSNAGYHSTAAAQLPSNGHIRYKEFQQTDNQLPFNPMSIQNLCELNEEAGTSHKMHVSAPGKDRSHPFYSRKREEPAEGMTRTRDKYRVVYTEKQRRGLEEEYNKNKFITTEIRAKISKELGLSARQIKIWFQNRRAKERRGSRKEKYTKYTDKSSDEDDNDTQEYSTSNLDNANDFLSSCRFTGTENISEERRQCRFLNQTEPLSIRADRTSPSSSCLFDPRTHHEIRPSISPSEWRMTNTTGSSFLPSIDVSPLTGNVNFDFELRL